jgi:RNA polymerase sigma-70 factor (ECF subfamily)
MEPVEHLFRREAGRMVATLTRIFGVHNLQLAEEVVQDAFCRALEVWKFQAMPDNPSAWLMATAKNRAVDMLRRDRTARSFARSSTDFSRANGRWVQPFTSNLSRTRSKTINFA